MALGQYTRASRDISSGVLSLTTYLMTFLPSSNCLNQLNAYGDIKYDYIPLESENSQVNLTLIWTKHPVILLRRSHATRQQLS